MPRDREDAPSMVTAGATANTKEGNGGASRESGLLCSHSHEESTAWEVARTVVAPPSSVVTCLWEVLVWGFVLVVCVCVSVSGVLCPVCVCVCVTY